MENLKIHNDALKAVSEFSLPSELGFGTVMAPIMIEANWKKGEWQPPEMLPYGNLSLAPTSKVLHYAQEIFEGLKAYKVEGKGPYLFRPEKNAERFQRSANRMAMPELPVNMFLEAAKAMTTHCQDFIPQESGQSLYIRPFMFATEESLGIKPSEEFKFLTIASPSCSYFSAGTLPVLIERTAIRACPGGTGRAKTGGNYAASLYSAKKAQEMGCLQTLWLDAIEKKYIEEMSGMNFACVINGELVTPELTETILDGITRDSILTLAKLNDIRVREEHMTIDDLISLIKSGECTEAFACGTAAIITPIHALIEEDGTTYNLPMTYGPMVKRLKEDLLAIQEGRLEGPSEWMVSI